MKTILIISIFIVPFAFESSAQNSDYFPLSIGSYYSYSYNQYDYEHVINPLIPGSGHWEKSWGEGYVFYSIIDSVSQNDSIVVWSIQQRDSILYKDSSSGSPPDSNWSISSKIYNLFEYKTDNHLIINDSMKVWFFPTSAQPRIYRFVNSVSDSIAINFYPNSGYLRNYTFKKNIGLTNASYWIAMGHNTGFFEHSLECILLQSQIVEIRKDFQIIKSPILQQNYPNPFNPATKIKFSITKGSYTTLKISDILGREIDILLSEYLKAGEYTLDWNGNNIPSGVYFYSLQTDDFSQTKKLLLLK